MTDFDSNWQTAMGGHLNLPTGGAEETAGSGPGPGEGAAVSAPKGYKPSSVDQRKNWNQFLDYLEKKGVGGSKDLDERDKKLGMQHLEAYNKAHPDQAVSPDFIPTAQYESYLIRKKGEFPGLDPQSAQYAFGNLPAAFRDKGISTVDNWLGSATSRQFYPTFQRVSKDKKQDFGTSFEDYLKGVSLEKPATTSTAQP